MQLKSYEYFTGKDEIFHRINEGEEVDRVVKEVVKKWTPGNEYLWKRYNIETLIDTQCKNKKLANQLLYSRIVIYRMLLSQGINARGSDPFKYKHKIDSGALASLTILH